MYKKARARMTVVCTLCTLLVLVGMSAVSLYFSLDRLEQQSEARFASNVNSVLVYLQSQTYIDQNWLAQTEADEGLLLRVETDANTLAFTGQNARRDTITAEALAQAEAYTEYTTLVARDYSPEPFVLRFAMRASTGEDMRAAVCVLQHKDTRMTVAVVQGREEEFATRNSLYTVFACVTLAASLLLAIFASAFSKWALRPAEEAGRRQTEFLSAASHELRSPLAVIRMSAGTIQSMPEEAQPCAATIEKECRRMTRLIADLLLLASGDAGLRGKRGEVSPQTLLLETFERFEPMAAHKEIAVQPKIEGDLRTAFWDAGRIEQVLAVLLDNAISYTPKGGEILLTLSPTRHGAQFTVEDSGPGIPEKDRDKVFQRFYRADESRTTKEHYGLGLSVAQQLTTLHGGKLEIFDSPLGGAGFRLILPYDM